jgi:hypothetical protein
MFDHTSEALVADIQEAHDRLGLYHFSFARELGEIIDAAQEVYVRDEIAKGLTDVATPGWDYLVGVQRRAVAEEEAERDLDYWYSISADEDEDY